MNSLLLVLALLYAVLAVCVWRFWRRYAAEHYPLRTELMALVPILLLHTSVVWLPVLHERTLAIGFGDALTVWRTVGVALIVGGVITLKLAN